MSGDSFTEEDGGELADVGGFSGAEVLDEGGNDLRILGEALDLILGLTTSVVVRHEELDQQKLERLCHCLIDLLLPRSRQTEAAGVRKRANRVLLICEGFCFGFGFIFLLVGLGILCVR